MKAFEGKVAVVTGGAGGLGRAVGLRLARGGARVALWDRDAARLRRAKEEFESRNLDVRIYTLELADSAAVRTTADRVRRDLGEVDILDNNVGVVYPGNFIDFTDAQINSTIDVNLKSFLWCTRAFLPGMIARGRGHLVMTASAAGLAGVPGMAVYSATKHAVVGFAESLRLELRGMGAASRAIGMTIVCPGFISTGMFEGAKPPWGMPWLSAEKVAVKIVSAIRLRRLYVREPLIVKLIPLLNILPGAFWSDWVGDATGMHSSMSTFGGRRGRN